VTTFEGPPVDGLVERVRALTPMIASTSFEAEAQRRPLNEVIDALKATGVFRSFVPARYGGYEIDLSTFLDIGFAVAHATRRWAGSRRSTWSTTGCSACSTNACRTRSSRRSRTSWRRGR
jgi:alkylation response protein AidB-like acyl-CoA dehydrogenase